MSRPRLVQFLYAIFAAGLFAAAGLLHAPLEDKSRQYNLVPPENVVAQRHPEMAILTIAPGGLRAPIVNYLWIRAQDLKQEGRYYDAMQLADFICALQPNFPGVWGFNAWNMAWNISVATHTPEERWLWVSNGMKLLRDRGIPLNPRSIVLYKELAWIFFSKMGQYLDDMHYVYKQRWASQMQHLLSAPTGETTQDAIEQFRPIAQAPLDKSLVRQGKDDIQRDQLEILLQDPKAAEYTAMLKAVGIGIDEGLLGVYNRFSKDAAADVVRIISPKIETSRDKILSELINNPAFADARMKLLSFVRAQLLWNSYRMDPQWMLGLMEKYGPLDWRNVLSHGLYWSSYGLHVCEDVTLQDINSLNTDRIVLNCLRDMTWGGKLTYVENPFDADSPELNWFADWRFVEPANQEHIAIATLVAKAEGVPFKRNTFQGGHTNYLIGAIQMLYASYRRGEAERYFQWIKDNYEPEGQDWKVPLDEFVMQSINSQGTPIPAVARNQITSALNTGMYFLAKGNQDAARQSIIYARKVYDVFQKNTPERNRLAAFDMIFASHLFFMLTQPRTVGYNLSLLDREMLYKAMPDNLRLIVYDRSAPVLQAECKMNNLDFNKLFPSPAGLEEFRRQQLRRAPAGQQ